MVITHRVVDIHPRILNSTNLIVAFGLTEKNDIDRISRYFGPVRGRDPRQVIPNLKQGQYLIRAVETGEQAVNTTMVASVVGRIGCFWVKLERVKIYLKGC